MKQPSENNNSSHKDDGSNTSTSVKKSTNNNRQYFEKHAQQKGLNQQHNAAIAGGIPSRIPSNSTQLSLVSSQYNMHRQNATRGDSTNASANSALSPTNVLQNNNQQLPNSRDKMLQAKSKQFSQNMLSKSQQFSSLQFNKQVMISQQSYMAQNNFGQGVGAPTPTQAQMLSTNNSNNFNSNTNTGGGGSVILPNHSTSSSKLNNIGNTSLNSSQASSSNHNNGLKNNNMSGSNYESSGLNLSSRMYASNQTAVAGSAGHPANSSSPAKRQHISKTSMTKRKQMLQQQNSNMTTANNSNKVTPSANHPQQQQHHIQSSVLSQGQLGLDDNMAGQHQKMMHSQSSSLAHKKYSVSTNLNQQQQIMQQISQNNSGASQKQVLAAGSTAAQSSIISKSESNNKLRRISNMKQKTQNNSNALDRPQGLILASSALNNNQNDSSNTSAGGIMHQFSNGSAVNQQTKVSVNKHQRQMPSQQLVHQQSIAVSQGSNLSNPTSSNFASASGGAGAPPGTAMGAGLQQSYSERTSMNEDNMWQMVAASRESGSNMPQSERFTANVQRPVRYQKQNPQQPQQQQMPPLHGNNSNTNNVDEGALVRQSANHAKSKSNKGLININQPQHQNSNSTSSASTGKVKSDHLFYVSTSQQNDQNLMYEDQTNSAVVMQQPPISKHSKHHQNTMSFQYHQNGNNGNHSIVSQDNSASEAAGSPMKVMIYDIDMENIQVKSVRSNIGNAPSSSYNSNSTSKHQHQQQQIQQQQYQSQQFHQHTRGAAAAPVNNQSIVCPIYQSKDHRLMNSSNMGSASKAQLNKDKDNTKTDQKDVKRSSAADHKLGNKGGPPTKQSSEVQQHLRRSMSGNMLEDVYLAKNAEQKPRKRTIKANSVIEPQYHQNNSLSNSQSVVHHNHNQHMNSMNTSDAYERSQFLAKSGNMSAASNNGGAPPQAPAYGKWIQADEMGSQAVHQKSGHGDNIKQERREAEPLADKLLYLTNQAFQSKIKSKSQLTQTMKNAQGLRKGIKSPGASQSTLQEPSAKALPTSSKVKISQKFNKFEQTSHAMKMSQTKQNLFQTKTLKKQGSGPLQQDFKELAKSPEARPAHIKKNGSISYAILPRQMINNSDLKAQKKMKSPSPSIKLISPDAVKTFKDPLQRMRSPQTVKAQVNFNATGRVNVKNNNSNAIELIPSSHNNQKTSGQRQSTNVFEARRLSQKRLSHVHKATPVMVNTNSSSTQQLHLLDANAVPGSHLTSKHAQSVTNSIGQNKRMSFNNEQALNANKAEGPGGAEESKQIYCMVDSRKNSQQSLHNLLAGSGAPTTNSTHGLGQVQILQLDAQGNKKASLNKMQLKGKEKFQSYMKPPGFLSQSPKAKKHSVTKHQTSAIGLQQQSMLITHGSNSSNPKFTTASGNQKKQFALQQIEHYQSSKAGGRELLNHKSSISSFTVAQKAILQIQAPKVVHLQSPPSRILVKSSPRVSPSNKIRKTGIQTCKVSIDALKNNHGGQQKIGRANSKDFLKTIKLMKRGSNSPSPPTQYMKSHQTSQNNSARQKQYDIITNNSSHNQINSNVAPSSANNSSTQLKNYNTTTQQQQPQIQQLQRERLPITAQNSNQVPSSTRATSQQNGKLFSRLQLRRAKDSQVTSVNNNEMVSISDRQSHGPPQQDGHMTAKLRSSASLLVPSTQGMIKTGEDQYSSVPKGVNGSLVLAQQYTGQQMAQHSKTPMMKDMAHRQSASNAAAIITKKAKSRERQIRASADQQQQFKQQQSPTNHLDVFVDDDDFQIISKKAGMKIDESTNDPNNMKELPLLKQPVAPERSDMAPRKERTTKNDSSAANAQVPPASTPSKQKVNQQLIAEQSNLAKNKFRTPSAVQNANTVSSVDQPNTKVARQSSLCNEELREQAKFVKDIEKLKRMIKLHLQNYNTAPPTTCEFYRIGRVLGKGAFGKVSLAMHKLAEQLVAIKSMSKETLQHEEDQRRRTKLEMGILKQCNHPNVVRLFDTFETTKHICFVIELCSGGDLFTYIKKRRRLKEDVARFFFKQLIEGLAYIHNAKKVVHRDIKLENILLDATGNVKICDFGVSRQLATGRERMQEQCGTPAYIAPEILLDEGYVGFKVDMWSAGVCLYAMLIGSVPFKASTMSKLQELIIKGEYDFKFQTNANSSQMNNPKAATTLLSEEVQDLIGCLLTTDPDKRLSAVEVLNHPWLQDADPDLDVYTEKEKQLIQREYMRLNLKLGQGNHRLESASAVKSNYSRASRVGQNTPNGNSQQIHETEQILFTEHNLETKYGEEEPQLQNQEEKSFILAPFNSVKSMFIDQGNQQIKEAKKDDPPFIWPKEITNMLVPRRTIKFSTKCREKNRIYEQNNNADLDNGVYNEFVNEQEREEGALMNKAGGEGSCDENDESKAPRHNNSPQAQKEQQDMSDTDEGPGPVSINRRAESQNSDYIEDEDMARGARLLNDTSSEDSLERSFRETELASDDEQAEQQIKNRKSTNKKQNEEAITMLFNSMDGNNQDDREEDSEESPAREQVTKQKPPSVVTKPIHKQKQSLAQAVNPNKGSAAANGSGLTKQKSRTQLRQQQQQIPAKASIVVHEYQEPEFVVDNEVVNQIQSGNVIPRWYLHQELAQLTNHQDRAGRSRDRAQRLNYVTATYFLLVKRKELVELQQRQQGRDNRLLTPPQQVEKKKSLQIKNV